MMRKPDLRTEWICCGLRLVLVLVWQFCSWPITNSQRPDTAIYDDACYLSPSYPLLAFLSNMSACTKHRTVRPRSQAVSASLRV